MHTEFVLPWRKFVPVVWPFHESELALSAATLVPRAARVRASTRWALPTASHARCRRARACAPPCAASARRRRRRLPRRGRVGGAASPRPPRRLSAPPASSSSRRSSRAPTAPTTAGCYPRSPPPRSPPTTRRRRPPRASSASSPPRHLRRRRAAKLMAATPRRSSPAATPAGRAATRWRALRRGVSGAAAAPRVGAAPPRRRRRRSRSSSAALPSRRSARRAPLVAALCVGWAASTSESRRRCPPCGIAIGDRLLDAVRAVGAAARRAAARAATRRAVGAARRLRGGGGDAAPAGPSRRCRCSRTRATRRGRECDGDQAAQLAREALPSPTAFHETWYRLDAVLVPLPERRTRRGGRSTRATSRWRARATRAARPRARGLRPHVLDAAFGRVLGAHAAREGADRAFGAALNVSRVGGGAWADADVALLAALLPLLEAHADYVAGYHQGDGEVCNASAAAERASRPAAGGMGLELMPDRASRHAARRRARRRRRARLPPPPAWGRRGATAGRCPILRRRRGCRRRRRGGVRRVGGSGRVRANADTCSARAPLRARARRRRRRRRPARVVRCSRPRPRTGLRRVRNGRAGPRLVGIAIQKTVPSISRADGGLIRPRAEFH